MSTPQPHGTRRTSDQSNHERLIAALPWLWLTLSALWAVVIFTTDQLAWPLAVWIATTVGPLTALRSRLGRHTDSSM